MEEVLLVSIPAQGTSYVVNALALPDDTRKMLRVIDSVYGMQRHFHAFIQPVLDRMATHGMAARYTRPLYVTELNAKNQLVVGLVDVVGMYMQ